MQIVHLSLNWVRSRTQVLLFITLYVVQYFTLQYTVNIYIVTHCMVKYSLIQLCQAYRQATQKLVMLLCARNTKFNFRGDLLIMIFLSEHSHHFPTVKKPSCLIFRRYHSDPPYFSLDSTLERHVGLCNIVKISAQLSNTETANAIDEARASKQNSLKLFL